VLTAATRLFSQYGYESVGVDDIGAAVGITGAPLAVEIRDRLGQWLADEEFAAAFGIRGRPGWPPLRLALVTVLQRAEKLTDRMAAEAVRARLDWKYLLGLPVDDPGFDHTVLAEFRGKVAEAGLEQAALDALLAKLAADGLVVPGVAAGAARRRRAAPGAGAELHPDHHRQQGGDQAAGQGP
jgi:transposase